MPSVVLRSLHALPLRDPFWCDGGEREKAARMATPSGTGPSRLPDRLARLRARAAEMQAKRDAQPTCPHRRDDVDLVRIFANGSQHVYRGCADCGRPLEGGQWLRHQSAEDIPIGLDDRTSRPPCVRCGTFGTELHHFAPRAVFGAEEAEMWPTAWLCPDCHDYWHRMMKGSE